MYLTPTEEDRLRVFTAAELARRTLARGLPLNAPEAVALVCDAMHLAARSGASLEEVMEAGRSAVPAGQVMDGVADIVDEIRLEVLLEEGSRVIVLHHPWGCGSADAPGAVRTQDHEVELAAGRERRRLSVRNDSERPVRVSSHFPFWRSNPRLAFNREAARGFRLDVPAGSSVRWAPGEVKDIGLVRYGGQEASRDDTA
ncbi:MAG TPA: urease subunit gamma [Streptosporangiaceae bacterium]